MAMLAEPRRKKHYNLVPKGKPLFDDSERFGTKMLEKMGWSKGKGLGSREHGQQEFVRIPYKNDADGLGFKSRDDQWTEHEKHFNGLLETLNSSTNSAADELEEAPTVGFGSKPKKKTKLTYQFSGQSLEEKSKNSKARVHYKKFTRGKDIAQYSEKDLANIFGKKADPNDENIYSQFKAVNAGDEDDEEENKDESATFKSNDQLITTKVSINDYFKMKMEALKQKKAALSGGCSEEAVEEGTSIKETKCADVETEEASIAFEEVSRKKKKSKKQDILVEEESSTVVVAEELPKEKKKKNKKQDNLVEEESPTVFEEIPKEKKKKSKKQEILAKEESPIVVEEVPAELSSKKKKKRKNTSAIEVEAESCKENSTEIRIDEPDTTEPPSLDEIPSKKKKNKKRAAIELEDEPNSKKIKQSDSIEISDTDVSLNPTKKKNKSKANSAAANEVSLTPLTDNSSIDTYTISTFCAEKFRNVDLHQFQDSTISHINGYGFDENMKLEIIPNKNDQERIMRLWTGTLGKYQHATPKHKLYHNYITKAKTARRAQKGIPQIKVKCLKRKHVFQLL